MSKSTILGTFAGLVLVLASGVSLAGCGSSGDGPMLSDEEKIKKTHEGRAAYDQATTSGRPSAPTAGK